MKLSFSFQLHTCHLMIQSLCYFFFFMYEVLKRNTKAQYDILEHMSSIAKKTQGHRVVTMGDTYKMQLQYVFFVKTFSSYKHRIEKRQKGNSCRRLCCLYDIR